MSDHDEEAHAAAYFSAPHASPQQPAKDRKRRRLHKAEREKDSPPWRTNLYIHPSQMELVGIEFEANEGQNSYINPASTHYQDGQNFRNGWKAIRAGHSGLPLRAKTGIYFPPAILLAPGLAGARRNPFWVYF